MGAAAAAAEAEAVVCVSTEEEESPVAVAAAQAIRLSSCAVETCSSSVGRRWLQWQMTGKRGREGGGCPVMG